MDYYGFYTGKILDAYEYLGCHITENGAVFRTFAPAALKVSVIGEFHNWSEIPMQKIYDGNFWECTIPDAISGMQYKYRIHRPDGIFIDHADPYGFAMEMPPCSASIIRDLHHYKWKDAKWLTKRTDCRNSSLNIYEVHLGSWEKKADNTWYSYAEIAGSLIHYVKEKGYNYIEIMPLAEHPCDNSSCPSPTMKWFTEKLPYCRKCTGNMKINSPRQELFICTCTHIPEKSSTSWAMKSDNFGNGMRKENRTGSF